jgi:hypothetical protein
MSILRTASALVASSALAALAVAQAPVAPTAPPAFGVPPAPLVSPFPAVSAPLTPASPLVAPLPAAPDPIGIGAYPAPPGPTTTLWSFLGLSRAQREYRQRAMARTPLGKLRERIQNPLSKLTGGLIPPFPPKTPTLAELQAPGPVGAAAKAKLDRMGAKDRIEAVQYLGTLDCHYWPEAEDALVAALRVDRNEWVRLEAAKTLLKGCCCTKKTITALTMAATCSDADGNPSEKSPRVVAAAQQALNHCLESVCTTPAIMEAPAVEPVPEAPRELPREAPATGSTTAAAWSKPGPAGEEKSSGGLTVGQMARPTGQAYYDRIARRPWPEIVTAARNGLAKAPPVPAKFALTAGMDLEMSGVHAAEARARADRPTNLLDLLLGEDQPIAPPAMAQAPRPAQPAPPGNKTAAQQARTMTPPARPDGMVGVGATAVPPERPTMTGEPSRIPPSVAAGVADPFAPKAVEVSMAAPARLDTKAMPTQVARVLSMMQRPGDPAVLAKEIDKLTAADVTGYAPMAVTLIQAAEELADTQPRSACVRALARGKVATPGVLSGLKQLTRDRTAEVRVEAAAALSELKTEGK